MHVFKIHKINWTSYIAQVKIKNSLFYFVFKSTEIHKYVTDIFDYRTYQIYCKTKPTLGIWVHLDYNSNLYYCIYIFAGFIYLQKLSQVTSIGYDHSTLRGFNGDFSILEIETSRILKLSNKCSQIKEIIQLSLTNNFF